MVDPSFYFFMQVLRAKVGLEQEHVVLLQRRFTFALPAEEKRFTEFCIYSNDFCFTRAPLTPLLRHVAVKQFDGRKLL